MNQYALVKKRLKEDVVQISLLRQTECGLKESCGGNCAGCHNKCAESEKKKK